MNVYVAGFAAGSVVGWLCRGSPLELVGLFVASLLMNFVVSRLIPRRQLRFEVLGVYCLGALAFSHKMFEVLKMTKHGNYAAAFGELPELFIGVLLVTLMGIIAMQLIDLLNEDRSS